MIQKRFIINKKTPVILQLSDTECGVASLAMLMHYYKQPITIEKLREMCGASRDGCKASTLINVARKCGFEADAYSVEMEALLQLTAPVIAYWNFNHYVVITRIKNKKIFI